MSPTSGSGWRGGAAGAYLLVNAATLLWAGNVVLGRALRAEIGPWSLAGLRAALASLLFLAVLLRARALRLPSARDARLLLAMAATGVVGFQVLQYAGLRHTTALNAGLMNATGPLLTLLLSRALLAHGLGRLQVAGALTSLVGVTIVLTGGSLGALLSLRFNPGDLLVVAAVVCWALYSILGRAALERGTTVWVTGLSTMAAVPLLTVPATLESLSSPPLVGVGLVLAVAYIGAGPSFLAFLAWNEGVRRLGPNGAMAFYNTLPLYAGVLGALFLGDRPGAAQVVGGLLVVAGCLAATRAPRERSGR